MGKRLLGRFQARQRSIEERMELGKVLRGLILNTIQQVS